MAAFLLFCYFVVAPLCYASVIRNGMKLVALPIPGTVYKNGSIIVNTRSEQNEVGGDQVQVHTVTVKTPAATLTFSNASQYPKSIAEQASSLKDGISAVSHLDPSELIDLDVPVRVNDLLELAKTSPTKFRQQIRSSQLMEKLIDTVQQKSIELYTLQNELEAGDHKIVKRDTWDAPDVPDGTWNPYPYEVRWLPPEIQDGRWWPIVMPYLIPESNEFGRSNEKKAAHLPIHHLHLAHRAPRPHHRPVAHPPHLHLLSLLRTEALPILRIPLALLNFILARPLQTAFSTGQPTDALPLTGLERPHRGPQPRPYHSLAYHDQESNAQLPQRLPEVNLPANWEYYGGISETDPEVDQILASNYLNSAATN